MRRPLDDEDLRLTSDLGRQVRNHRRERGITQEKLAEISGIDRRTISDIENGKTNPSFTTLFRLISPLRMPTDFLFYPTEEENKKLMNMIQVEMSDCTEQELESLYRILVFHKSMLRRQ